MTINRQIAFNLAVQGLFIQGRRAVNDDGCLYLAPDGSRCAVGMMIDLERYDAKVEGGSVLSRAPQLNPMLLETVGTIETDDDLDFLSDLQTELHDRCGVPFDASLDRTLFLDRATTLAARYGLTVNLPEGE